MLQGWNAVYRHPLRDIFIIIYCYHSKRSKDNTKFNAKNCYGSEFLTKEMQTHFLEVQYGCDKMVSMKKKWPCPIVYPDLPMARCWGKMRTIWCLWNQTMLFESYITNLCSFSSRYLIHGRCNTCKNMRRYRSNLVINVMSLKRETIYKSAWLMLGP